MATPNYFSYVPNVKYTLSVDAAGNTDDITIKDYFRLLRVTEGAYREATLYTEYVIKEGERPEQISYEIYGDEQYYWVILQSNNIVDYNAEWPLGNTDLEAYVVSKYGSVEAAADIHHWETVEVTDDNGSILLRSGLVVSEGFEFSYRPDSSQFVTLTSFPISVSNMEYERRLNDSKENIVILDKKYLYDFVREYKNTMSIIDDDHSVVGVYDAIQ